LPPLYCHFSPSFSPPPLPQNQGVNFEDENFAVDLPIFSIHGNHDDPTRDGGTDMLAALDLLAACNLVNYYGRHDEIDKVDIDPVLIRKGENTKVALYGMGSMRDERLNRMWSKKKVKFLKPADEPEDDNDKEGKEWFNIFSLHQNRDYGRGAKNCVHESMIPEWMDLILWGHEHEVCMGAVGVGFGGGWRKG
jgi:double-strand break repair protein MRE11